MSATKTKKPAAEAVEEGKTNAATEALTDEEKQRRQEEQDKAFFAKLPDPCVYCGPTSPCLEPSKEDANTNPSS